MKGVMSLEEKPFPKIEETREIKNGDFGKSIDKMTKKVESVIGSKRFLG